MVFLFRVVQTHLRFNSDVLTAVSTRICRGVQMQSHVQDDNDDHDDGGNDGDNGVDDGGNNKFAAHLDLSKLALQHARVHALSEAPRQSYDMLFHGLVWCVDGVDHLELFKLAQQHARIHIHSDT